MFKRKGILILSALTLFCSSSFAQNFFNYKTLSNQNTEDNIEIIQTSTFSFGETTEELVLKKSDLNTRYVINLEITSKDQHQKESKNHTQLEMFANTVTNFSNSTNFPIITSVSKEEETKQDKFLLDIISEHFSFLLAISNNNNEKTMSYGYVEHKLEDLKTFSVKNNPDAFIDVPTFNTSEAFISKQPLVLDRKVTFIDTDNLKIEFTIKERKNL